MNRLEFIDALNESLQHAFTPGTAHGIAERIALYSDAGLAEMGESVRRLAKRTEALEATQQALQEWAAQQDATKAPAHYHPGETVFYGGQHYNIAYLAGRVAGETRWALAGHIGQPPVYALESELTPHVSEVALIADTRAHTADDHRELLNAFARLFYAAQAVAGDYPGPDARNELNAALAIAAQFLATEYAVEVAPEAPDFATDTETYDGIGAHTYSPMCDCRYCRQAVTEGETPR